MKSLEEAWWCQWRDVELQGSFWTFYVLARCIDVVTGPLAFCSVICCAAGVASAVARVVGVSARRTDANRHGSPMVGRVPLDWDTVDDSKWHSVLDALCLPYLPSSSSIESISYFYFNPSSIISSKISRDIVMPSNSSFPSLESVAIWNVILYIYVYVYIDLLRWSDVPRTSRIFRSKIVIFFFSFKCILSETK